MGRGRAHTERRHGFTLVEVLAALAIAAVIIAATSALVHNVALHFDHGTRGVSEGAWRRTSARRVSLPA